MWVFSNFDVMKEIFTYHIGYCFSHVEALSLRNVVVVLQLVSARHGGSLVSNGSKADRSAQLVDTRAVRNDNKGV